MADRDSQRARLYAAEKVVFDYDDLIGDGSIDAVVGFVDNIVRTSWWQKRSGVRVVQVADGRGRYRTAAALGANFITVPRGWARSRCVVIHELSHLLVPHGAAPHGKEFAGTLVQMLDRWGPEGSGKALRASFDAKNVKWRGGAAKPYREPALYLCDGCEKPSGRQHPWVAPKREGEVVTLARRARFCSKRCAVAWFEHGLMRIDMVAARRAY